MNLLEDIIAGATDDDVSTTNLLRKVIIVTHYVKATEVAAWAKGELNGYRAGDELPTYRRASITPVMGTWTGRGGASTTQLLGSNGLPDDAAEVLFHASFYQPVSELEELAALPKDPSQSWEPWQVMQYNKWNAEGKGTWMQGMQLLNAHRIVTRASIRGVIDTIRNNALDLALSLHSADESAGTLHGPTVADAPIATTINNFTTNVFGHSANLAFGDKVTLKSKVGINDLPSLLAAARELGLDEQGIAELSQAADAPSNERPSRLRAVARRVGSGSLALSTAVAAEVAGVQLNELIQRFLGQV